MNRFIARLNLAKTNLPTQHKLFDCPFTTPHWQPDHQEIISSGRIELSATQRFITPQCSSCLMPYLEQATQLWINADVYLTNHESLCELLQLDQDTADAKLILAAYSKYGVGCLDYFSGYFSFVIYDPLNKSLFAAVDQFSNTPLYFSYEKGRQFICSNEFSPFRKLSSKLTVNEPRYLQMTMDTFLSLETCYREVMRLEGGHYLLVNAEGCHQHQYWQLKKQPLPRLSREQYYAEFRQYFNKAVRACLRNVGENCSHISGGMDSSSVTAQAAIILTPQNRQLYAFTALPNLLDGPSNRKNWYYHELPIVESVLKMYPNIIHHQHYSNVEQNIFEQLDILNYYTDQPLRNVANIEWICQSYQFAGANNARTILTGASGNATISWAGMSLRNKLGKLRTYLKLKLKPDNALNNFFSSYVNPQILHSNIGQQLLKNRSFVFDGQLHMLTRSGMSLKSTAYLLQLWYGTRSLDPTINKELAEFCYSLPQWIFYKNNRTINRRLLVREGLRKILPETLTTSTYRGEQASDFYLSYNHHRQNWYERLLNLKPTTKEIIWKYFDKEKMLGFFEIYPQIPDRPNNIITTQLMVLSRCLSFAGYLDQ